MKCLRRPHVGFLQAGASGANLTFGTRFGGRLSTPNRTSGLRWEGRGRWGFVEIAPTTYSDPEAASSECPALPYAPRPSAFSKGDPYRCFAASPVADANAAAPPKVTVKTGLSLSKRRYSAPIGLRKWLSHSAQSRSPAQWLHRLWPSHNALR